MLHDTWFAPCSHSLNARFASKKENFYIDNIRTHIPFVIVSRVVIPMNMPLVIHAKFRCHPMVIPMNVHTCISMTRIICSLSLWNEIEEEGDRQWLFGSYNREAVGSPTRKGCRLCKSRRRSLPTWVPGSITREKRTNRYSDMLL